MSKPDTIAIDGPAASGKTTLALALAHALDYLYFDTGVMYRTVTLAAIRQGVDLTDEKALTGIAEASVIDVVPPTVDDGRSCTVLLNGEDVTGLLRDEQIDRNVSLPSAMSGVRVALTLQQRRIGERGKVVMVGRDIGTVVLPDADLKIYLDASVEARAMRRWQEVKRHSQSGSYESILEAMKQRDKLDSQRAIAPLKPADDAIQLNTTGMNASEVYEQVIALVSKHTADDGQSFEIPRNAHGT